MTANGRSEIYSAATFYPLWNSIIPDEIATSSQNAFGFFASLNMVMNPFRTSNGIPSDSVAGRHNWRDICRAIRARA